MLQLLGDFVPQTPYRGFAPPPDPLTLDPQPQISSAAPAFGVDK